MPTSPQNAAGCRTDPPVSDPRAAAAMPAATAAADPPLDPPGVRSRSHGFFVTASAEFSVDDPIPNSSRLVLPIRIAPAFSNLSTAVAVYVGTNPRRIREDAVAGRPFA